MTWGLLPRACPRQSQPAIECPICGIQSSNYAQHYNRRHGQRSSCIRQRLPQGWATEQGFLYCACGDLVRRGPNRQAAGERHWYGPRQVRLNGQVVTADTCPKPGRIGQDREPWTLPGAGYESRSRLPRAVASPRPLLRPVCGPPLRGPLEGGAELAPLETQAREGSAMQGAGQIPMVQQVQLQEQGQPVEPQQEEEQEVLQQEELQQVEPQQVEPQQEEAGQVEPQVEPQLEEPQQVDLALAPQSSTPGSRRYFLRPRRRAGDGSLAGRGFEGNSPSEGGSEGSTEGSTEDSSEGSSEGPTESRSDDWFEGRPEDNTDDPSNGGLGREARPPFENSLQSSDLSSLTSLSSSPEPAPHQASSQQGGAPASTEQASTEQASTHQASTHQASTHQASTHQASSQQEGTQQASSQQGRAQQASTPQASSQQEGAQAPITGQASRDSTPEERACFPRGIPPSLVDRVQTFGALTTHREIAHEHIESVLIDLQHHGLNTPDGLLAIYLQVITSRSVYVPLPGKWQ